MLHAILLLQLVVTPPEAHDAEKLVHASIHDYDQGHFEQALDEAEQAYRLYPLPPILYNIAQCQRALGHWERAAFFYEEYLAKVPDSPTRKAVEDLITEAVYRAKAEHQPSGPAAPAPQPVVVVTAPTAAAPAPKGEGVPAAALEPTAEPAHGHATSYVLGSVAVASLVVAIVGIVYVESFETVLGRLNSPSETYGQWEVDQPTAASHRPAAANWMGIAGAAGAVALGTGTAAVFTW